MIKGIFAAILGALLVAAIIVGIIYLFFSGILLWLAGIFVAGIIIGAIIMFIILFVFFILIFFALFYCMAEKKPTITPGEYKLEEEKGKNE